MYSGTFKTTQTDTGYRIYAYLLIYSMQIRVSFKSIGISYES